MYELGSSEYILDKILQKISNNVKIQAVVSCQKDICGELFRQQRLYFQEAVGGCWPIKSKIQRA